MVLWAPWWRLSLSVRSGEGPGQRPPRRQAHQEPAGLGEHGLHVRQDPAARRGRGEGAKAHTPTRDKALDGRKSLPKSSPTPFFKNIW